jgi:serralysin
MSLENNMNTKTLNPVIASGLLSFALLSPGSSAYAETCLGEVATIVGSGASETIHGTSGDDVIVGLDGDDEIYGEGGRDIICGGNGNDFVDGGPGNDVLSGDSGNDTFADQGGGIDTVDYSTSPSGVVVFLDNTSPSSDGFGGQDGFDNVENASGSAFSDLLFGDRNKNVLNGRGGDDFLFGKGAADKLTGGDGNDTGYGGPGKDTCTAEFMFECP